MKRQAVTLLILILNFYGKAQQVPDTGFAVQIEAPVFSINNSPKVYIDGAHNNIHKRNTGFLPLANLLEKDGYKVEALEDKTIKQEMLFGGDILVIANALHSSNVSNWVTPNPSAFDDLEIKAINSWVKNGGSLLLIADHMPCGGAAQKLAKSFGIEWQNSFVGVGGKTWPPNMFTTAQNTLNPIGADLLFKVDTVSTFTGSSLKLPKAGKPILVLTNSDTAFFTDTAWSFGHAKKQPLKGYVQGGVLNYGKGKIAVFAEAAMFTAQLVNEKYRVGFNSPVASQNIPFIRNVFYYLAKDSFKKKAKP